MCPAGTLTLEQSRLIVHDPAVLTEPLVLTLREIASIDYAPDGSLAMGVFGRGPTERAALISIVPERPRLIVRFREPMGLPSRKRNDALFANSPIRPPGKGAVSGIWLRTDATWPVMKWWPGDSAAARSTGLPQ